MKTPASSGLAMRRNNMPGVYPAHRWPNCPIRQPTRSGSTVAGMRIELPRTDLAVHPLCLGGNVFGWTADGTESFAVLDAYADAGGNFVDTADSYLWRAPGNSGGESETIIGHWMA